MASGAVQDRANLSPMAASPIGTATTSTSYVAPASWTQKDAAARRRLHRSPEAGQAAAAEPTAADDDAAAAPAATPRPTQSGLSPMAASPIGTATTSTSYLAPASWTQKDAAARRRTGATAEAPAARRLRTNASAAPSVRIAHTYTTPTWWSARDAARRSEKRGPEPSRAAVVPSARPSARAAAPSTDTAPAAMSSSKVVRNAASRREKRGPEPSRVAVTPSARVAAAAASTTTAPAELAVSSSEVRIALSYTPPSCWNERSAAVRRQRKQEPEP